MTAAKYELQARARELRLAGKAYDEIVEELGVSKSSVSLWVRDLSKPPRRAEILAHVRRMSEARWESYREERARLRERAKVAAAAEIGRLTDRELFLVGVGLYWSEGSKAKPHRPQQRAVFVNSDPGMIQVHLAWLALLGVDKGRLRFSVMIHESADVEGVERYWREVTGAGAANFGKTTLKKHNPKTVRQNVGASYRGCLTVRVLDSADLYGRIEGWWCGIVLGAKSAP